MPSASEPRAPARPAPPAPASASAGTDLLGKVPPPLLLGTGILSVQVGAGLAARMFGTVSAAGLTGLRLWAATLLLAGFGARPAIRAVRSVLADRAWRDAAVVVAFGVTLGIMNFSIYQAFSRIPLGIAVTIEFLGPLAVAVATSRRLIDVAWVVLAATGVTLLGTAGVSAASFGGQAGHGHGSVLAGVLFAMTAAAGWACYILLASATGRRFSGGSGLVVAMVIASVVVAPAAVISAGRTLLLPAVLGAGLAIGMLSSVIPYRFELETLRRVPPRVFGIWMSLEPAVAALVGVVLLSQALSAPQWIAIGCVIVASAGAALGGAVAAPQA
ncbi:MAG TPA: EamA family transporter [Streptosporangiaceae bacterium]|nr:EamA family transporter [Streptosporangiaceae bacterium]